MRKKIIPILIAIIFFLIGFNAGYIVGYGHAISWSVDLGFKLLDRQGIKIDLSEALFKAGVIQYKNNIGYMIDKFNNSIELKGGLTGNE